MINKQNILVSIIIPVFNDENDLEETLKCIERQDFDENLMETIVVDNGSSDNSLKIAGKFDFVKLVLEHEKLSSPYSARNRGIENSNGKIIVLLDSTCKPAKTWLREGINEFLKKKYDIAGGEVKFNFKKKYTISEYYDSLINIKMKKSIIERQVSKTANMFINRDVFDKIGYFPEGVRSGADVRWTRNASISGYKIHFIESAIVYKEPRKFLMLLKKQWRVGIGQPSIWIDETGRSEFLKHVRISKLLPPKRSSIRELISNSDNQDMINSLTKLQILGFFVKIVMFFANVVGYFKIFVKKYFYKKR